MKKALILAGGGGRGAYQAGVWQYLTARSWRPDLICGTSIGAVNAAAIGSGLDADQIVHLWYKYGRRRVYRLAFRRFLTGMLTRRRYEPMMDTAPMVKMLNEIINFDTLAQNPIKIVITAINMATAELKYFTNRQITIDHLLASSAMPMLFPARLIAGQPYWDGGVMANVPVAPALEAGATEIIVVLLSPVGAFAPPPPRDLHQTFELLFEHFLIGSYNALTTLPALRNEVRPAAGANCAVPAPTLATHPDDTPRILTVAPRRMLGLYSLLNFSRKQSARLVQEGYRDARQQLGRMVFA